MTAVAFSPDGRRVATGDDAGVLRTWDACTGCLDPQPYSRSRASG